MHVLAVLSTIDFNTLLLVFLAFFSALDSYWRRKSEKKVDEKLDDNTQKTTDIHRQTNGERSEELLNTATALRRVAELTKKTEDAAAALAAETRYREHERGLKARET